MLEIFRGRMPDITPAQLVGLLLPGVAVVATLLRAFGVYDLNAEQIAALEDVLKWGAIAGGALFLSDAGLRASRNAAESKVEAASMKGPENVQAAPGATINVGAGPIEGQVGFFDEGVAGPGVGSPMPGSTPLARMEGVGEPDFPEEEEPESLLVSDEEEFAESAPTSVVQPSQDSP